MYFKIDTQSMFFEEKGVTNLKIGSKTVRINQVSNGTIVNFDFKGRNFNGKLIKKNSDISKFVNNKMFLYDKPSNKMFQIRYGYIIQLGFKGYYVFDLHNNGKGLVSPQKLLTAVQFTEIYKYKTSGSELCELVFLK